MLFTFQLCRYSFEHEASNAADVCEAECVFFLSSGSDRNLGRTSGSRPRSTNATARGCNLPPRRIRRLVTVAPGGLLPAEKRHTRPRPRHDRCGGLRCRSVPEHLDDLQVTGTRTRRTQFDRSTSGSVSATLPPPPSSPRSRPKSFSRFKPLLRTRAFVSDHS